MAPRRRCPGICRRALQRRPVLPPAAVDDPVAGAELLHGGHAAAVPRPVRRRRTRRGALPDQPRRGRPARVTTEDRDAGLYLDEPTEQLEPPRQLAPSILAIDIGGPQFAAGLVTTKGELVDRASAA